MTPKQRRVDFVFIPISKEERKMDIEREFVALNERLLEKQSRPKNEPFKWLVGKYRKEKQTVLLKPKVERMKPSIKPKKIRGSHTNWFTPTLRPPIYKVVNIVISQSRGVFWGWFIEKLEIFFVFMTIYLRAIRENGFIRMKIWRRPINVVSILAHTLPKLYNIAQSWNPVQNDEICAILKNPRKAGQPLYVVCIQPLIKVII